MSKRKRRSFWQPDSETLVDWLDSQSDLGTSLELIIVDAIKQYGKGDAIKSFLAQREQLECSSLDSKLKLDHKLEDVSEVVEADIIVGRDIIEEGVLDDKSEDVSISDEKDIELDPEDEIVKILDDNLEKEVEPELKAEVVVKKEPETTEQIENEDKVEEEEPYDPIAVMLGDVGSTMD